MNASLIPQSAEEFVLRLMVVTAALMLDWLVGEPAALWRRVPHPVVLFGRAIGLLDHLGNRKERFSGRQRHLIGLVAIVVLASGAGLIGHFLAIGGIVVSLIATTILLAGRSLDDHIRAVSTALESDLTSARHAVGMIVGRDTSNLDAGDISRAAIETGAENLSDGVIAPAFWFLILGLPGLLAYKMVNTADSMIGYRNARYLAFGWAAARFDDILNYVPARITALLICLASIPCAGGVAKAFAVMQADARTHQSPNAGWPEAAMAGGLDIWLAGPRRYGNRMRNATRMNKTGKDADRKAILASLRVLINVQILLALLFLMLGLAIAPEVLI